MSSGPANDVAEPVEKRLDRAFDTGSEREKQIALRDWLEEALLVREGWTITAEVARERANNLAQGLMGILYGRLT